MKSVLEREEIKARGCLWMGRKWKDQWTRYPEKIEELVF